MPHMKSLLPRKKPGIGPVQRGTQLLSQQSPLTSPQSTVRQGIGQGEAGGGTQLQSDMNTPQKPSNPTGRGGMLGMLAEKYSQGLINRKKKAQAQAPSLSQQALIR